MKCTTQKLHFCQTLSNPLVGKKLNESITPHWQGRLCEKKGNHGRKNYGFALIQEDLQKQASLAKKNIF